MAQYSIIKGNDIKENFLKKVSQIRGGRINSSLLEDIYVEAYPGVRSPIPQLATITTPEPAQLMITPFDKSINAKIVDALNKSDLGVNPNDDGAGIRLVFPPMTQEDRQKRVKHMMDLKEEARVMVRQMRQEAQKDAKKKKEAGEYTEDDLNNFEKDLQKEVDTINQELEEIAKSKEAEIMKV